MQLVDDVKLRYGKTLVEEHCGKHERVHSLRLEAQELTAAAALKAERCRADGERRVREVEDAAEQQVQELEQERLRVIAQHHLALLEVEDRIERGRAAAEEQLRRLEAETQLLYDQCEADIQRINVERDTATHAARQRCTTASQQGEAAALKAEQHEQDVLRKARSTQAEQEQRAAGRANDMAQRLESEQRYFTQAVDEAQVQVAADIERLLREATCARGSLARNRTSLDERLDLDLKQCRDATAETIDHSHEAMEAGRLRLRQARETISAVREDVAEECRDRERKQTEVMHDAAETLELHVKGLTRLEVLHMPRLVKGLEDLASRLRGGRFVGPPPRLPPTPPIPNDVAELQ